MYQDDDKDVIFFRWQIKNFSFASNKTGEALHTPPLVAEILDDTKWYLSVYPRGKEDSEFIEIFVNRCNEDDGGHRIGIIFTIELEAADSSRGVRRVSAKSIFERKSSWGFHQYIKRKTLLEDMKSTFLPDDILTIHCKLERVPSDVKFITEYIAETIPVTVKTEVPWTIENWREIEDFSEVHKDAEFTGDHEAAFRMSICESEDADKNLILNLKKLEAERKNLYVSCRISVLDKEGSEAIVRTTHHFFSDSSEISSQKLFDREDIKDSFLQDGALSLRCVLNLDTGKTTTTITTKVHESPKDEDEDEDDDLDEYIQKELIKDYENLYLSGNFSDVKVRVGSKVVNCHKSMLYARSPVLSDLVDKAEQSLVEGDELVIDIDDLDGNTLEQMIYFLYSDKINNINPTSALKLFVAGHKYRIPYLKQQCSLYLSKVFNFENVYDILMAAHIYEDGDLKRRAISYLAEYFSRICLTKEWENFRKTEKELGAYVCREIRRIKQL